MSKPTRTEAGRYYERRWVDGELRKVELPAGTVPTAIICRRVVDFPPGRLPATASFGDCAICQARVAYNAKHQPGNAPRVCMQCAGIKPLPF